MQVRGLWLCLLEPSLHGIPGTCETVAEFILRAQLAQMACSSTSPHGWELMSSWGQHAGLCLLCQNHSEVPAWPVGRGPSQRQVPTRKHSHLRQEASIGPQEHLVAPGNQVGIRNTESPAYLTPPHAV